MRLRRAHPLHQDRLILTLSSMFTVPNLFGVGQHAYHWEEEVRLLFEEKQHTLRFLEWHANWWADRASIMITDQTLFKGRHAYAERQAELRHRIGRSFADMWRDTEHILGVANNRSVSSLL